MNKFWIIILVSRCVNACFRLSLKHHYNEKSYIQRDFISLLRMGILSIVRDNSRTLKGKGLRNLILPSLPIRTSIKPRGRNFSRSGCIDEGSVSISTTTSRLVNGSGSLWKKPNCCWKFGSFGLSAKTITGRFCQVNSSKSEMLVSRYANGSVSIGLSAACAATPKSPIEIINKNCLIRPPALVLLVNYLRNATGAVINFNSCTCGCWNKSYISGFTRVLSNLLNPEQATGPFDKLCQLWMVFIFIPHNMNSFVK